jgi:hypothetical protein
MRARRVAMPGLLLMVLSGCAVSLMAPYDNKTEDMLTALQSSFSTEHQALIYSYGTPDCLYSKQTAFYQKAHADIADLRVHVGALSKNAQTTEMAKLLENVLSDLEAAHKRREAVGTGNDKCMSADVMAPDFAGVEQSIGAMLKLEVAKQRQVPGK